MKENEIGVFSTEAEYRAYQALHYSRLSDLVSSPIAALRPKKWVDKPYFRFGGLVDDYLTQTPEYVKKKYVVIPEELFPSDMVKEIMDEYLDYNYELSCVDFSVHYAKLLEIAAKHSYGNGKYKPERIINDMINKGNAYYTFKWNTIARRQIIVDSDQLERANKVCHMLRTHRFTARFFNKYDPREIEAKFQWGLVGYIPRFGNELLKCLFDLVIIDHRQKKIIPIDLKTSAKSVYAFPREIQTSGCKYYIQAGLYMEILKRYVELYLPKYEILPFRFVVASSSGTGVPLVFNVPHEQIELFNKGGRWSKTGTPFRGVAQLIKDFHEHNKLQMYDCPIEVNLKKGVFDVNIAEPIDTTND